MKLNNSRPIIFFDLETTGVQVGYDHIVQICLLKVNPDGSKEQYSRLVRPTDNEGETIHINPDSIVFHQITDEMVKDEASFKEIAEEVSRFIGESDLAGYNSNKFDVPMLVEEFLRAGVPFSLKGRRLVDVQNIFHKMEQRTLSAAYEFYCGKELTNAHTAEADTMATYEVLLAQIERYKETPFKEKDGTTTYPIQNNIEQLSAFSTARHCADLVGHIGINNKGESIFNFGKYKGQTLKEVFKKEPAYYDWMMKADFPLSTKEVVKEEYQTIREELRQEKAAERKRQQSGKTDNRTEEEMLKMLKNHFEGR